jgi:hypothetical protein
MKNKDMLTSEKVYMSTEYNKFKFIKENRAINSTHVDRLVKSITQKDAKIPIIVDRDFNILEGQHRYEAYKKLSMPIHYVIRTTITMQDIRVMNSSTQKWKLTDFLLSYQKAGNEEYKYLEWFHRTYKFGIRECLAMCLNTSGTSGPMVERFKAGDFEVKDIEVAKIWAIRINAMKDYYSFYKKRTFIFAMLKMFTEPGFEWARLWSNVQRSSAVIKNQGSRNDFLVNLEQLYNHKTPRDKRIRINIYD